LAEGFVWGQLPETQVHQEKYDPNGMFRVWNGVGGLRPENDNAGSLLISIVALIATLVTFSV
jgi:hypothetical protein